MNLDLTAVMDKYPNPLYIIRPRIQDGTAEDFEYIYVNEAFCKFLDKTHEELSGHRFLELFDRGEAQWLDVFVEAARAEQHFFVDEVCHIIHKMMYTEIFHVAPDMCGCIIHDYRELSDANAHEQEKALRYRANCDYLTGFYNRYFLQEMSEELLGKENVGITYLDINNLKETNDTLGHEAGDALIRKVAGMMRDFYRDSLLFRLGGDEFLIVTEGLSRDEFMEMSANNKQRFEEDNLVAMGYQFYEHIYDLQESINQCDHYMYEHKKYIKYQAAQTGQKFTCMA
jgi:diguanylate cyclase (GGDEF)-like protein